MIKILLRDQLQKFMLSKYLTDSPSQTKKIGKIFAKEILKIKNNKKAIIIGLEGDLGGGKTTFLQGFASGLGIKEKILSPTFVIMRKHKIKIKNSNYSLFMRCKIKNFCHIDCYRINRSKDMLVLEFKEIISNPQNIIAVEWAERVKSLLPKNIAWIKFDFTDKNKRRIIFKNR